MIQFRCKRSGNIISFTNEDDIEHMRKHEGYEEVKYETHEEKVEETGKKRQVLKLRNKDGTP